MTIDCGLGMESRRAGDLLRIPKSCAWLGAESLGFSARATQGESSVWVQLSEHLSCLGV